MKKILVSALLLCTGIEINAQELYIFSDPASNAPAKSIVPRINNMIMPMEHSSDISYRISPEVMIGYNKNLMFRANAYASNMFGNQFKFEGASIYAKYRFLSNDDMHKHFRMAAFGKVSASNNPYFINHTIQHTTSGGTHTENVKLTTQELNLEGNHSGVQYGIIATQLVNKTAISLAASSIHKMNNLNDHQMLAGSPRGAFHSILSAGYLMFPRKYDNYKQMNFNIYGEVITQKSYTGNYYFVDAAPGIQFIFNSISRLDLGYRIQVAGNMDRFSKNQFLVKFEYNFLNALK